MRAGKHTAGTYDGIPREAGASLTELMFAMATGLVILGAMLQALSYFQQRFMKQQYEIAQQQDLRLGLEVLEQELRLAGSGSLTTAAQDTVEFVVNLQGLSTKVMAEASFGQTTLSVEDGRGWDDRKTIMACWAGGCETLTLARNGQRYLLTVTQPLTRAIPNGASVILLNHVRYYSRLDGQGILRLLRQVDGGASVLVRDVKEVRFSYWDENGQAVTQPALVKLVVVEAMLSDREIRAVREISLRT